MFTNLIATLPLLGDTGIYIGGGVLTLVVIVLIILFVVRRT
jgi:hypothetical protein